VKLTYSNNPNADASGDPSEDTGETPEDKTIVFTYKLDGTKVDGTNTDKTLKDAEFVLFRLKEGETGPSYTEVDGKKIPTNVEYALVTGGKLEGWTEDRETAIGTNGNGKGILVSDASGLFGVSGLDAGTYYLEEVKAPAGYNLLKDPVKLTIDAEISGGDAETNQPPTIGKLDLITEGENGEAPTPGDKDNGTVSLEVQNNMGALLPSTGMGTTLFYIAGAALVLAAGVLFMMKRRTDSGK
jgi:LPXTG-motif cell wall-anchored protein